MSQSNSKTVASIEVTFLQDFAVAALSGTLGEPYAQALREQLRAVVLGGRRYVLVDLTGVAEVDSRGLGAIISLVKLARERGGAVRCCGARPNVADVFTLTRLDRILDFYANQAVALAEPWDHPAVIPADS